MIDAEFERLSIAHWRRDPRERNRYNSWNKMGVNCLPLGSGAGGRWGKTRFFQQNDLKLYMAAIKKGEKPLAMGMISPDHAQVSALAVDQLEQQQLDIVALEKVAGTPLLKQLLPLVKQWESAGLINVDPSGSAQLTEAGEFWVVNLQQLIDMKLKEILCAK